MATLNRPAPTSAPLRVLIVDDNVDAAEMLGEILARWGHAIEVATDGPDALDKARSFQPQLVLLDIGLPGMDGYEVASELQAEAAATGVASGTLVAVTGYGQSSDRERTRHAGFAHHLVKPLQLTDVLRVVEAVGRLHGAVAAQDDARLDPSPRATDQLR